MKAAARLYRLVTGDKVGSARLLLYPLLGYGVSGAWAPWPWTLNTAVILGGVLFASLLNDYHDAVLLGEDNAVGRALADGTLSRRHAHILTWLPWLAALACFLPLARAGATTLSLALLWVSFLLSAAYCAPPLRLKARPGLGLVAPPVGIYLLYLESLWLLGPPTPRAAMVSVMLFFYTWYLDFLHLAEDSLHPHEVHRLPGRLALAAARWTAAAASATAVALSLLDPALLVAVLCWGLRGVAVARIGAEQIATARKSLWSPVYRIEEFPAYVALTVASRWVGG